MFFKPNISLHKICFKGFAKEGIKLKICLSIQNNFICALTLNSLFGDLYIINRKIKIGYNEKIDMMEYHLNELCKDKSEGQAVLEMRSHLLNYLKGLPENKEIKNEICKCKSRIEIINCLEDYRKKLISLD